MQLPPPEAAVTDVGVEARRHTGRSSRRCECLAVVVAALQGGGVARPERAQTAGQLRRVGRARATYADPEGYRIEPALGYGRRSPVAAAEVRDLRRSVRDLTLYERGQAGSRTGRRSDGEPPTSVRLLASCKRRANPPDISDPMREPDDALAARSAPGTGTDRQADMRAFPRLPEQPIFYPVLSEDYAREDRARLERSSGAGFVTPSKVRTSFLDGISAGGGRSRPPQLLWIPAGDMDAFNAALVGRIEVVREFP